MTAPSSIAAWSGAAVDLLFAGVLALITFGRRSTNADTTAAEVVKLADAVRKLELKDAKDEEKLERLERLADRMEDMFVAFGIHVTELKATTAQVERQERRIDGLARTIENWMRGNPPQIINLGKQGE